MKRLMTLGMALLTATTMLAQMGTRFPSERKVINDPKTGVELVFLTSKSGTGDSKIYQTHNQWTADGRWVIFRSDRVKGEAMAVNEETGDIVQVTEGGFTGMLSDDGRSMNICIVKMPQHLLDRYNKNTSQVNDNNTPLHLMKPQYRVGYGIPKAEEVKAVMDRVLRYIDSETPATLVDKRTGKEVKRLKDINADTQLKQGGFRLTSYEWGVTYSGVLAAYQATGDTVYRNYVSKRHRLLADIAPYFRKLHAQGQPIDGNVRRVIDPHALDDAGAVCCSMIKGLLSGDKRGVADEKLLHPLIDNYIDYIINKEYRLSDGTFARLRPQKNTVWLDDMFMGIPAVAYMGRLTGQQKYYDEAVRQVLQFADRMWVPEKKLFRHGWVEAMQPHPAFHWGRANGWAILTLCEVLDVLPADHPRRGELLQLLRQHAEGLAALQHHDGFWHQLLDRQDTYLETSATAIYAYCLAHGVCQGWLSAKAFGPVALQAWHAVTSCVNQRGQVENVCVGTGMGFDAAFYAYRPVHAMAAHGYGPVIWAGAEMLNLLRQQHPKLNDSAVQFYDEEVPTNEPIFNYDGKIRY